MIEDLKFNLGADPWSEAWSERPFISIGEVHERVCLQPALWRKKYREHYECRQEWLDNALEEHKREAGMPSMSRENRTEWVTGWKPTICIHLVSTNVVYQRMKAGMSHIEAILLNCLYLRSRQVLLRWSCQAGRQINARFVSRLM